MSQLLNTSAQGWYLGPTIKNDDSLHEQLHSWYRMEANFGYMYDDTVWPRDRFIGLINPIADDMAGKYEVWTWAHRVTGHQEPVIVTGRVVDTSSAAVAGATVKLFDSPTNVMVDNETADSNGYYSVWSPYTSNAYLVAYKTGSPDQAGTSVNTVPA